MNCQCKKPDPREMTRACKTCGRYVPSPAMFALEFYQREMNRMFRQHVDWVSRFPHRPAPVLPRRVKVARRIKELRRRLRNAQAALHGAWEADYD